MKITKKTIKSSIDTGLNYWYFTRHGLGPGMMPKGVNIVDCYEEGYKTWFQTDKLLTTEELNFYDIQEQNPPAGAVTRHGVTIAASKNITAAAFASEYDSKTGEKLERFQSLAYDDDYRDSYDSSIPLIGWHWCVGLASDDEGHEWRGFSDESWDKVKHLSNQEIYDTYPASLYDSSQGHLYVTGYRNIIDSDIDEEVGFVDDQAHKTYYDGPGYENFSSDISASTDIEGMSLINYKNYKIFSNPGIGWEVLNKDHSLVKSGLMSERAARRYIDENLVDDIHGSEDIEDGEDFLGQPDQEFTSAETAINGRQGKLPAAFSRANIPDGALVLDYGGGTIESEQVAQNYLDQFNATEALYDPYNQSAEHNREVISMIKKNGGADIAICSNVLNVIKEAEVRLHVLKQIRKLLKNGAIAYITVYEGGGSGEGSATQGGKSYQNKRKLVTYLDEIKEVFPDAERKGSVIIAPKTGKEVTGSTEEAERYIGSIDPEYLENEIKEGIKQYFGSPEGGWPEDEVDQAVADYSKVEIRDEGDHLVVEVRAELSYEGLIDLSVRLNTIVEQYDEDAYFEAVEPGIIESYIYGHDSTIKGTTNIDAASIDFSNIDRARDEWLDPDSTAYSFSDDEEDDIDATLEIEVDFDFKATVIDDGYDFLTDPEHPFDLSEYEDKLFDTTRVEEDIFDLLLWFIPSDDGTYRVKGKATLTYEYDYYNEYYHDLVRGDSYISDVTVEPSNNIASSTKVADNKQDVTAAMTEEELDDAILNQRPFSLDDFKKYKVTVDPDAITAEKVEVGDVINVDEDASEVNLGTVVKILAINDPAENWIDYTFRCEVVEDPGRQTVKVGDIIDLHFDGDEAVGHLVIE